MQTIITPAQSKKMSMPQLRRAAKRILPLQLNRPLTKEELQRINVASRIALVINLY